VEQQLVYQPVKKAGREALPGQVARQMLDLIESRQLEVGSRLPSLEELAEYLGVSRTSVREAMKLLDAWHVITIKHGVGTFVAGLARDALLIPFRVCAQRGERAMYHMHQLRQALEPYVAETAARNAKPEHIQKMEQALARMKETLDSPDEYMPADIAFHSALAEATGNELFLLIIYPIISLLHDPKYLDIQYPGGIQRGQPHHQSVFEHVKAGRAEEARQAMRTLLDVTRREIQAHYQRQAPGGAKGGA
jgi:GntR family transcriptional repressor for pyruvate dehydrogenase complex